MDKAGVLKEVASSKEYQDICKRICNGSPLHKDLFQELIIILHNQEEGKITALYHNKQIKYFIIRVLQNQFQSSSSPFYKQNKDFSHRTEELKSREVTEMEEDAESMDLLDLIVNKSEYENQEDWYRSEVVKAYINSGSLRKLEAKTGIARAALSQTIKKFRESVNSRIKDLEKINRLSFLTCEQKTEIIKQVINKNLDIDEIVSILLIKNRICLKKAVCG